MQNETLIRMANQIAAFFEPMADQDAAIGAIAQHLGRFWTPRMRQRLAHAVDAGQDNGLHDLVRIAVARHRRAFKAESP